MCAFKVNKSYVSKLDDLKLIKRTYGYLLPYVTLYADTTYIHTTQASLSRDYIQ